MKQQSAVEFISTYGFMFLALSLAIAIVLFLASYNGTAPSTQCTSFGTITCNYINYYPNTTAGYAIATLVLTNAQSAPINITSFKLTIDNLTASGVCTPAFMYPGEEAVCTTPYAVNSVPNNLHNGGYVMTAGFCGSGVTQLNSSACSYTVSNYTGTIEVYNAPNDTTPFSVIAVTLPSGTQLPTYNAIPIFPVNYTFSQSSDWVPARNLTGLAYAYTTNGATIKYFGVNTVPFPSQLPALINNAISCASPYNTTVSIAYTSFYLAGTANVLFREYADNAVAVYYKLPTSSSWTSVFGNSMWSKSVLSSNTATTSLTANTYQLAVEWANTCGTGVQAFSLNGISQ